MKEGSIFLPTLFMTGCVIDYTISDKQQNFTAPLHPVQEDSGEDTASDFLPCPYTDAFDQRSETPVDILVVADRSGSMYGDRERVEAGLETFINELPPRGWQFLVVSANDERVQYESRTPLTPGATAQQAVDMYNYAEGGEVENGLNTSMLYIDNYATWLNPNAALHIIYMSDEDDYSFGYFSEDSEVVAIMKDWIDTQTKDLSLASIVNIDYPLCSNSCDEIGTRYLEVTDYVEGKKVDICSDGDQWGEALSEVKTFINPRESYHLTYWPRDETLEVTVDGSIFTQWTYHKNNNKIRFSDVPAAEAHVEIFYHIDMTTTGDTCPF